MTATKKLRQHPKPPTRSALARPTGSALSFKKLFADVHRRQRERIRKAGKHECVITACGTASRVTGRGGKILKRPVTVMRFYECKICGKTMTPNGGGQRPPAT